jgi:Uma2 family endonuclease
MAVLHLKSGDRLTRDEFERRYDATPGLKMAELIDGIVHCPLPSRWGTEAVPRADLIGWVGYYHAFTAGTQAGAHPSIRLDPVNEPQPDVALIIQPSHGGQTLISADGYLEGGPELVAEVVANRVRLALIDAKRRLYQNHGVREYVVWRVLDGEIDWFVLRDGAFVRLPLDASGRYRSEVFPGLWLDPAALVAGDPAILAVLHQGLASPEHAAFVARLAQQAAQAGAP